MCDLIQASVNVSHNLGAEKTVDRISRFQQGLRLSLITILLAWQSVPVVAIAKNSNAVIRQIEVGNRYRTEWVLWNECPSATNHCRFDSTLYVRSLILLSRLEPDSFARTRACQPPYRGGCATERLAADGAFNDRHVELPTWRAFALSVYVAAGFGAKANLTARLLCNEVAATMQARSVSFSRSTSPEAYCQSRFCRALLATDSGCYFCNVLGAFDVVPTAMDRLFPGNKCRAVTMCTLMFWTRHNLSTAGAC